MSNCIENMCETINKYYKRNRSLVDTMSKAQVSLGKAVRVITKSATHCGCIKFWAKKQPCGLDEAVPVLLEGELCPFCRQEVEKELGQSMFYLVSLMLILGFNPEDIIERENSNIRILGKFNLR